MTFEEQMDELLMQQARECANGGDGIDTAQEGAKSALNKFLKYIKSLRFDLKCRKASKETGVPYKVIKNQFVANVLGKIADTLGMVLNITGSIIEYAVSFIGNLINNIVHFTVTILNKIINIVTFNCGSMANA